MKKRETSTAIPLHNRWNSIGKIINVLVLIGSLIIIAMISIDVLIPKSPLIPLFFSQLQFWICIIFIADFFVRLMQSPNRWKYTLRNFLFLIVSIPYLNILSFSHIEISRITHNILRIILLLRGGYGLMIVVNYVTHTAISSLFVSYIVTMLAITYFSSLFFFDVEQQVNPDVKNFWSALYWASMQVAAEGSSIFPVTDIGKVLNVILSVLGVSMIPIGAAYVTTIFNKKAVNRDKKK